MSRAEVERFAEDLKGKPALLTEIRKADGLATAVKTAVSHGYDFTFDEAKTFVMARASASGKPLSGPQLDRVVGGVSQWCFPCWSPPPGTPGGF